MKPITKDIIQNNLFFRKYRRRLECVKCGIRAGIASAFSYKNNLNFVERKYIIENIKFLDNQCLNFIISILSLQIMYK